MLFRSYATAELAVPVLDEAGLKALLRDWAAERSVQVNEEPAGEGQLAGAGLGDANWRERLNEELGADG